MGFGSEGYFLVPGVVFGYNCTMRMKMKREERASRWKRSVLRGETWEIPEKKFW